MGQALHWAECLMGIINSNLMCCDYIRCTNEDTGIRDEGGQDSKLRQVDSVVCM